MIIGVERFPTFHFVLLEFSAISMYYFNNKYNRNYHNKIKEKKEYVVYVNQNWTVNFFIHWLLLHLTNTGIFAKTQSTSLLNNYVQMQPLGGWYQNIAKIFSNVQRNIKVKIPLLLFKSKVKNRLSTVNCIPRCVFFKSRAHYVSFPLALSPTRNCIPGICLKKNSSLQLLCFFKTLYEMPFAS